MSKALPRDPGEPDLHYRYRWVDSLPREDDEPENLKALRQMLAKTPEKFYTLYAEQQKRFDIIKADAAASQAKKIATPKMEPCETLVAQMINEWHEKGVA